MRIVFSFIEIRETFHVIGSREPSPILDVRQESLEPTPNLQLQLMPYENIQSGQVYELPQPQAVTVDQRNQILNFKIDKDDFDRRYQKYKRSLNLSPDQKHLEDGLIRFHIYNELYTEQNSISSKIKKIGEFFKKKK